jgi:hypothetical protein
MEGDSVIMADGEFVAVEGTKFMADMILEHWEGDQIMQLVCKIVPVLTREQWVIVKTAYNSANPKAPRLENPLQGIHKAEIVEYPYRSPHANTPRPRPKYREE